LCHNNNLMGSSLSKNIFLVSSQLTPESSSKLAQTAPYVTTDRVLGAGEFSVVCAGYLKTDPSILVAVKKISRKQLSSEAINRLQTEVRILKRVAQFPDSQRHFVQFRDIVIEPHTISIISDIIDGCTLSQVVIRHKLGMPEYLAKKMVFQILTAVKILHSHDIAHRDLKLENIIFDKSSNRLRLVDFGFARETSRINPTTKHRETVLSNDSCGSLHYAAPEMFGQDPCDSKKLDIWALGVITFGLLKGKFPFTGITDEQLALNILSGKYFLPGSLSDEAKSFVALAMEQNPNRRPSVDVLLQHPWVRINPSV